MEIWLNLNYRNTFGELQLKDLLGSGKNQMILSTPNRI